MSTKHIAADYLRNSITDKALLPGMIPHAASVDSVRSAPGLPPATSRQKGHCPGCCGRGLRLDAAVAGVGPACSCTTLECAREVLGRCELIWLWCCVGFRLLW
jgi:hypothetical protein